MTSNSYSNTSVCRHCGGRIVFRRWVENKKTGQKVYGNPVLVIHIDGTSCSGGQLSLAF